jgi:hypothetical protein
MKNLLIEDCVETKNIKSFKVILSYRRSKKLENFGMVYDDCRASEYNSCEASYFGFEKNSSAKRKDPLIFYIHV